MSELELEIEVKIQAGLKTVSPEDFAELSEEQRISLIMYFAHEPIRRSVLAKYAKVPEDRVKLILEARP